MQHYRDHLREQFLERKKKNVRYSMRAFALSLGISASGLNQILNGKKELSVDRALNFARRIGMDEAQTDLFLFQVQMERARSNPLKQKLLADYQERFGVQPSQSLNLEEFQLLNNWYSLAVYEILRLESFSANPSAIAKALEIDRVMIDGALARLSRLHLIRQNENGAWIRMAPRIHFQSEKVNDALRQYHLELLELINRAITETTPHEKDIGSNLFLINEEQIGAAKKAADEYWAKLSALSEEATQNPKTLRIFQSFVTLFPISKPLSQTSHKGSKS